MENRTGCAALLAVVLAAGTLAGCERERTSGAGLVLPPGDIEAGKSAFVDLGCNRCHTVAGAELPAFDGETTIGLQLGGKVLVVKTYGELVTSIINPEHIVSPQYRRMVSEAAQGAEVRSLMPDYNSSMTVSQLIDLVTFLDSRYQKLEPYYSNNRSSGIY